MSTTRTNPVFTAEEMATKPFLTLETYRFKTDALTGRDIKLTCREISDGEYTYAVTVRGPGVPVEVCVWCNKFEDVNLVAQMLLEAKFGEMTTGREVAEPR